MTFCAQQDKTSKTGGRAKSEGGNTLSSDLLAFATVFLPPMPTEFSTRQENTITVRASHPDRAADLENRFGVFEFHSNLPDLLPEEVRDSARAAQEEVSKPLSGSSSFFVVRVQILVDTLARDFIIESNCR